MRSQRGDSTQTLLSCSREVTVKKMKDKGRGGKKRSGGRRARLAGACLQAAGHGAGER